MGVDWSAVFLPNIKTGANQHMLGSGAQLPTPST
jgi:hypothetical protein